MCKLYYEEQLMTRFKAFTILVKWLRLLVGFDFEGPLVMNDNAFELFCAAWDQCPWLPKGMGARVYKFISEIDDAMGDYGLAKEYDPSYSAGHTLKCIWPLLVAMGINEAFIRQHARETMRTIPYSLEIMKKLAEEHIVKVSTTSYDFFPGEFFKSIGFDFPNNSACTLTDFNLFKINEEEQKIIIEFLQRMADWEIIKDKDRSVLEYDKNTGLPLPGYEQYFWEFFDFIWKKLLKMEVGSLIKEMHPIGQSQKLEALERFMCEEQGNYDGTVVTGDSQTDVKWLELACRIGLAILFNAKGPVMEKGNLIVISPDCKITYDLITLYSMYGREAVLEAFKEPLYLPGGTIVATYTPENLALLKQASMEMREFVRGAAVAGLS